MVSATDPAAVVATFKRLRVPPALSTMVGRREPAQRRHGPGPLRDRGCKSSSSPIGPGEARHHLRRDRRDQRRYRPRRPASLAARIDLSLADDHLIELTISVVLAYGSYMLADVFHLSGVIATVTAAIVLGNVGPGPGADGDRCRIAIDTVWEFFAYLLTAVVFLLVGLAIPPDAPASSRSARSPGRSSASSSDAPSWSTSSWAGCRASRPARGSVERVPSRVAPRPVLGRSARGGGRRDGALTAGRHPAARACSGDHLRGRPCSRCSSRDDDRLGRRPGDRQAGDRPGPPAAARAAV